MDAVTQPPKKTNRIGLELATYRGSKTTLCAGCGHNAISERIIDAFYELGTDPKRVIKLSGIGCSSKTPAYFLGGSHGFNAVHGRMPLAILKAALSHRGTAMIDVISPCVTFNNHEGSTKSYSYVKDHDEPLGEISFVPFFDDITVEYHPGTHDRSEDARRVAAAAEEARRRLRPDDRTRALAACCARPAARRVRDRRDLRRAGQGRLHHPAQPRGRAAGRAADEERTRPGTASPGRGHGEPAVAISFIWNARSPSSSPTPCQQNVAGSILARIEEDGFTVRAMRLMHMTKREAEGFYAVHKRAAVLRRA